MVNDSTPTVLVQIAEKERTSAHHAQPHADSTPSHTYGALISSLTITAEVSN